MPDRNDGDTQLRARSAITAFHAIESILGRKRRENPIRVIERLLQIRDQLGLGFGRIVSALFANFRWLLAFKFIEEGKLGAGNVLHLFAKAAYILEVSSCRDKRIFVLGHGFSDAEKISLRELKCPADTLGDGLRNVVFVGGSLAGGRSSVIFGLSDCCDRNTAHKQNGGETQEPHLHPPKHFISLRLNPAHPPLPPLLR